MRLYEVKLLKNNLGFTIWMNPTLSELRALLSKYHELRGTVTSEALYFWNAFDSQHSRAEVFIMNIEGEKYTDCISIYISDNPNISSPTWDGLLKKYPNGIYMTGKGIPYGFEINKRFKQIFQN